MDYKILIPEQLGEALKSERKSMKITQKEAAASVGLLPKTISNLENYTANASVESLFKLLSALQMKIILTPVAENKAVAADLEW